MPLLDLGHEPAVVVAQEGGHNAAHGVTEAADVQDVAAMGAQAAYSKLDADARNTPEAPPSVPKAEGEFAQSQTSLATCGEACKPGCFQWC